MYVVPCVPTLAIVVLHFFEWLESAIQKSSDGCCAFPELQIGSKLMETYKYQQMAGRAGRAGALLIASIAFHSC
jgi:hypothetical protein